jgi:small basic protein
MTRPDDASPSAGGPAPADPAVAASCGPAPAAGAVPRSAWWRSSGGSRWPAPSWLVPVLALVAGLVAGFLVLPTAPGWLAPYLPVAVVAALDALAGGLRAALERVFDDLVFVVSFLTNAGVAVLLVLVGDRLGVGGALTTGVVVVFGIRIFTNVTALRRHLFRV